jgi:Lipid A 3-O-deacylase (PagL)
MIARQQAGQIGKPGEIMRRMGLAIAGFVLTAMTVAAPASAEEESLTPGQRVLLLVEAGDSPPRSSIAEPAANHHFSGAAQLPSAECSRDESVYRRGQWSVSYLTGYYGCNLGPAPVPFSMLPEIVRINRVINDPRPDRLLRGSFESILQIDTLPVVHGQASIVIGASCLLRYNFHTDRCSRLVCYLQTGGGGMYTDAYLHHSMVLSSGFEFIINWGGGLNFLLTDRLALMAEWSYLHFSNGGMVLPNISVNQIGVLVGLTYYFGRRKPI